MTRFFSRKPKPAAFFHVPSGRGALVNGVGALVGYRHELLGHLLSGKLLVESHLVTLAADARPYAAGRHQGLKFLHLLKGGLIYRHGQRLARLNPGDSLLFDATTPHGIEVILQPPVSYLSIVLSMRD